MGRPRLIDPEVFGDTQPLSNRLWRSLADLRALIERRILAAMPDREAAGVAVAFVTGSQTAVPNDALLAMRNSGLAHLLSVSGLHIGLAVGILFFLIRAGLALVPAVALRWPIKKWAAGLALLGAAFYMLLSGASVPVVRSFVMAGIVLLAVIVDRQPITMRPVAIAAVAVLLIWPDSLVGPELPAFLRRHRRTDRSMGGIEPAPRQGDEPRAPRPTLAVRSCAQQYHRHAGDGGLWHLSLQPADRLRRDRQHAGGANHGFLGDALADPGADPDALRAGELGVGAGRLGNLRHLCGRPRRSLPGLVRWPWSRSCRCRACVS